MRPHAITILVLTFTLASAGCTKPDVTTDPTDEPNGGERPNGSPAATATYAIGWADGDYWVQRAYYEDKPDETVATHDYYVEGSETVNGVETLRAVSSDGQRAFWIRATDGALIKETIRGQEKTYDPPCVGFIGAITQATEHACHRLGTQSSVATATANATLNTKSNGTRNVTVPAGSFDATQLETTMGGQTFAREFYSARACFPVRVVTVEGQRTIILELVTHQCTKGAA